MEQNDLREVLVVRVPSCTVDEAEAIRLATIRAVSSGVWVLPASYTWTLEQLPCLTVVTPQEPTGKTRRTKSGNVARKQATHARLLAYRKANGLGCLEAVAKMAHRTDVTADVLRRVISNADVLEDAQWAAVARALDKLDKEATDMKEQTTQGEAHG